MVDYAALLEELIDLVREDAGTLGCIEDVERSRDILVRGTSADRQIEVFERAMADGADRRRALEAVVDMLIRETVEGV